ncbi:MAG: SRPBCC family protein [Acidobacteria bacterium]|nr:SRPBCC family protein [Acidobacteriota bacterium]
MDTLDRIEKQVTLNAPVERVWRAISDAREFGAWFGVAFDGPFGAGAAVSGRITPTTVDAAVAKLQEPHAGMPFTITVERLEPPRHFSFRWHPYAVEPGADYSGEPTTLVEFTLTAVAGGTHLVVSESGFHQIPLARRAAAFTANDGGWAHQCRLIALYVHGHAS